MILAGGTGYKIDPCKGCLETLFQTNTEPLAGVGELTLQVDSSDTGKLVAAQIDEMKFESVLQETIPDTNNLTEIYSTPSLDCK